MEPSIDNFHISVYIPAIKRSHFTFDTYAFQVLITVVTHAAKHSKVEAQIMMCCIVVIMLIEWQLFLHTKYSLNTMAAIYLCIFKALNQSILVHQHIQKKQLHNKHARVMLCFINFFLMAENRILPQLLHTENASLNC